MSYYRVESEMEDLLSRSFPNPGDADRVRQMFEDSLADNALDLTHAAKTAGIVFSFPQAILVSTKPK